MNFFRKIKNSVYSPEFYGGIAKSSFKSGLGYFLLFTLILAVIQTLYSAPGLLINLPRDAKNILGDAVNKYPASLEVRIESGLVSTNAKEPYFIKDDQGKDIAVIDTKTPYSASQFDKYGTAVWVTQDSVFYHDNGGIKTQSLSQFPDTTINRDFISTLTGKISPYVKYLGPGATALALLLFYSLISGRMIYLLFVALLIMLLTKIMKKGLKYGEAYKVGLYAATLGMTVDLVKSMVGWGGFPFMFTLITLVVVYINFRPKAASA